MNIESLTLNVCEVLNAHVKQFKELSEIDTSKMSLSEKLEITQRLCILNGAIVAYRHVFGLCRDAMEGGKK
jgi:hypothetical protein